MDDSIIDSKINLETVEREGGMKNKHVVASQNMFRRIVRNGMKVKSAKTAQICSISDAISFKACAHIHTGDGLVVNSGDSLKLLGFAFGSS